MIIQNERSSPYYHPLHCRIVIPYKTEKTYVSSSSSSPLAYRVLYCSWYTHDMLPWKGRLPSSMSSSLTSVAVAGMGMEEEEPASRVRTPSSNSSEDMVAAVAFHPLWLSCVGRYGVSSLRFQVRSPMRRVCFLSSSLFTSTWGAIKEYWDMIEREGKEGYIIESTSL